MAHRKQQTKVPLTLFHTIFSAFQSLLVYIQNQLKKKQKQEKCI